MSTTQPPIITVPRQDRSLSSRLCVQQMLRAVEHGRVLKHASMGGYCSMQFQRLFPSSQSPHPSPPQHHINTIRSNRATEQLLKSRRVPALGISYFLSLYSSQPCSLSLCRTQDQRGQHPQHLDLEDLKRVSHLP